MQQRGGWRGRNDEGWWESKSLIKRARYKIDRQGEEQTEGGVLVRRRPSQRVGSRGRQLEGAREQKQREGLS